MDLLNTNTFGAYMYSFRCARVVQHYLVHKTLISIYSMFQEESSIIPEKVP
jgi:hypothetical protein